MQENTVYFSEERVIAYQALLSGNTTIKVDPDELDKVMQAISTGSIVVLRNGIINPSYLMCITEDEQRVRHIIDENANLRAENARMGTNKPLKRLTPLKDIFEGQKVREMGSGDKPMLTGTAS